MVSTIPNSTIYHKKIYNIKSIKEIQAENQISNLMNRLNNTGPASISTLIRLKQAQIKNCEPNNILTNKISHLSNASKTSQPKYSKLPTTWELQYSILDRQITLTRKEIQSL